MIKSKWFDHEHTAARCAYDKMLERRQVTFGYQKNDEGKYGWVVSWTGPCTPDPEPKPAPWMRTENALAP